MAVKSWLPWCCSSDDDLKKQAVENGAGDSTLSRVEKASQVSQNSVVSETNAAAFTTGVIDDESLPAASPKNMGVKELEVAETDVTAGPAGSDGNGAAAGVSPGRFAVQLQKAHGKKLGLSLDPLDERSLYVVKITPGVISDWNTAHSEQSIRVGDRILEVNGKSGNAILLLEMLLRDGCSLDLTISRPAEVKLFLQKADGETLGLDLKYLPNSVVCLIERVNAGLVQSWLRRPGNEGLVRDLDRIFMVNGIQEDPKRMLDQLRDATDVTIHVRHY